MYPIRTSMFTDHPYRRSLHNDRLARFSDSFVTGSAETGIDLYVTGEGLVMKMAVPGLTAADIDVDVEGRRLTVTGELKEDEAAEGEERRYLLRSLPSGSFSRTVRLPRGLDTDAITATVNAGLLTLSIPRSDEAKARKIEISDA